LQGTLQSRTPNMYRYKSCKLEQLPAGRRNIKFCDFAHKQERKIEATLPQAEENASACWFKASRGRELRVQIQVADQLII